MSAEMYRRIGIQIRAARQTRGVSMCVLAVELEVTQSMVSLYERGERKIPLVRLAKACALLELDMAEVIDWSRGGS